MCRLGLIRRLSLASTATTTTRGIYRLNHSRAGRTEEDDYDYPTSTSHPQEPTNRFITEPSYINRYRDPSRHDSYQPIDHHQPHKFRIRPTATQSPPSRPASAANSPARKARLSMEQSWLSPSTTCHHQPIQPTTVPPTSMAICFPGSSSQYLGMGSFLLHSAEFRNVWTEAMSHLEDFEPWMASLNLVDRFQELGYSTDQATLLGSTPPSPSPHCLQQNLKDIVFKGPQNLLSKCSNAQPGILITSIGYLRTLQVEGKKMPIKSMTKVYAGHSSGEYTACVASNVIDFKEGIFLTKLYGILSERSMALAGLQPSSSMSNDPSNNNHDDHHQAQMSALLINEKYQSKLGIKTYDYQELISIIDRFNHHSQDKGAHDHHQVEIASFNSSNQIVLSGTRVGVLAACSELNELEIANRAADLPCSSPFHSAFMKPASQGMKIGLESIRFRVPETPILITRNLPSTSPPTESTSQFTPTTRLQKRRRRTGIRGEEEVIETVYITEQDQLADLKTHLYRSICRPVWWTETVNQLLSSSSPSSSSVEGEKNTQLVFVGPGKALHNLCKKQIAFNAAHQPADTVHSTSDVVGSRSLATMEDFKSLIH
ncbi:hypothetical protein PSHT_00415 [Puccinia striiformis]|uniref:[acyl-carrier-protein] S-malonyltransferase n=1 Tax=Puccinia striiformis TaxID=27350 RepID=A0A2S4WN94_9BASI|nr:hypothetical protein PSHT_00415 [Puccinia striiformis]